MIPTIDPRVKYVGASHLRKLNSNQLRQLEGVMVVRDNSEPLAVIVPYATYLDIQRQAQIRQSEHELLVGLWQKDGSDVPADYEIPPALQSKERGGQARRTPREKGDNKR